MVMNVFDTGLKNLEEKLLTPRADLWELVLKDNLDYEGVLEDYFEYHEPENLENS